MGARAARTALSGLVAGTVLSALPGTAVPAETTCEALQVRNTGSVSQLHRIDLSSGATSEVARMPAYLSALGYADGRGVAYGLAAGFADGAHVLTVRPDGRTNDRGVVRGRGGNPFELPESGAIAGNRWYVVEDDVLHAVDVDRLRLVSAVVLEPHDFGDIGVDPVDGRLYSVSDSGDLVRIDRSTGRIEPVRRLPDLPADHYGSLVVGPEREIYVAGYRGGIYRVERDGSVTLLGETPRATASDMAGCLTSRPEPTPPEPTTTTPRPPTSTPTPPEPTSTPPQPTPTPPDRPEPTSTEPTPPHPRPPRPTPTPTGAPPPSANPPSTTSTEAPVPAGPTPSSAVEEHDQVEPTPFASTSPSSESDAEATGTGHSTEEKRRWALAVLVMILGGSIAVRRVR